VLNPASNQRGVTVVIGRLDPLMLRGLDEALVEDESVAVLASALQGAALENAVKHGMPSVVILDETIEHSLLERLKAGRPAPAVLIFAQDPPLLSRTMLQAAGVTCLARSASTEEIVRTVHRAGQAGRVSASENRRLLQQGLISKTGLLTPRERRVLQCLVEGQTHSKMAGDLHTAIETARSHTASIRRKLGVPSNRELIGLTFLLQGPERTDRRP
jgi:DNA-binding NarL/FixJ family response regulator